MVTKDPAFNSVEQTLPVSISQVRDTNKMELLLKSKIDMKNRSREIKLGFREFFDVRGNGLNLGRLDLNNTKTVTLEGYDTEAPDFFFFFTYLQIFRSRFIKAGTKYDIATIRINDMDRQKFTTTRV